MSSGGSPLMTSLSSGGSLLSSGGGVSVNPLLSSLSAGNPIMSSLAGSGGAALFPEINKSVVPPASEGI